MHTDASNGITFGEDAAGIYRFVRIQFHKEIRNGTIGVSEGGVICRAIEWATRERLPVVAFVSSAGIRITEGTPALMQMIRIAGAVKEHAAKGLLLIAILENTTLGGTSASLVSLADIIIAEKNALYGFSGKRIVQDTTHEQLPPDFQTAAFAKRHGMVDIVTDQKNIPMLIAKLLRIHAL